MKWSIALAALVAVSSFACARSAVGTWSGDRFVHAGRGYAVGTPGSAWSPTPLEGADVSLVGPGRARMSLTSRCNASLGTPKVLARHLRFSIGPHEVLASEALAESAGDAWRQRMRVDTLEIETVTTLHGRCVFDWVLVAPSGRFEAVRPDFARWRESFSLRSDS